MMTDIVTMAGKDWRLFWADRRGAILGFLVPIILASAFGIIFDRSRESSALRLPMLIVAESDSRFIQEIVNDLRESSRAEITVTDRLTAERRIADRRPGVAVVLPDSLARLTAAADATADKPRLDILHNPLCRTEAPWAEAIVTEAIMKRLARERFGRLVDERTFDVPFRADSIPVTGSALASFNSYSHSFNGMTLQYLMFWGMESGLLLLRERSRGAWARTRVAPVSLTSILLGKLIATAGIALLQIALTFLFGRIVFGVTIEGSWLGFLLLAGAVSLMSAAIGLMVAAVGETESRARSASILVILSVSMLGGLWIPTFLLPGWVRDVALSLPTTWAMCGFDGVTWQGRGLGDALPAIGIVAGFAVVFLAVAGWRLANIESKSRRGFSC